MISIHIRRAHTNAVPAFSRDGIWDLFYKRKRLSCDRKLFIGRDNENSYLGARFCELLLSSSQSVIRLFVKINAQIAEIASHLLSYIVIILADACGKYDIIHAVHRSRIGTDIFRNFIGKYIHGDLRFLVSAVHRVCEITDITRESAV